MAAENSSGSTLSHLPGRPFQRGVSGNPGGRPKMSPETRATLKAMMPSALKKLRRLVRSKDERVALAAVQVVLNRVLGREESAGEAEEAIREALAGMTPEQALRIVEAGKRNGVAEAAAGH